MTTLTKLIVSTILAILLFSCEFNMDYATGIQGSGHVITTERTVNSDFDTIEVSRGLDVYLTQSESATVSVEADENLQDIIITKLNGNVLEIYADENIGSSKAQKVHISFKDISKIVASSGSDVYTTNTISGTTLELETNSGSDMELDINVQSLICSATSGSDLELTGKANNLKAEAHSGSDIDASDLLAEKSTVKASSGASVSVNSSKELIAKANSGGDVTYYGKPEKLEKSEGVSGGIHQK